MFFLIKYGTLAVVFNLLILQDNHKHDISYIVPKGSLFYLFSKARTNKFNIFNFLYCITFRKVWSSFCKYTYFRFFLLHSLFYIYRYSKVQILFQYLDVLRHLFVNLSHFNFLSKETLNKVELH